MARRTRLLTPHRAEVAGSRGGRLSGGGVEDRAGAVAEEDLLLLAR